MAQHPEGGFSGRGISSHEQLGGKTGGCAEIRTAKRPTGQLGEVSPPAGERVTAEEKVGMLHCGCAHAGSELECSSDGHVQMEVLRRLGVVCAIPSLSYVVYW